MSSTSYAKITRSSSHDHNKELTVRRQLCNMIRYEATTFLKQDYPTQSLSPGNMVTSCPQLYTLNTIAANAPSWIRAVNGLMELLGHITPMPATTTRQATPTPLHFDTIAVYNHLVDIFEGRSKIKVTFAFHGTKSFANIYSILLNNFDPNLRRGQSFGPGTYSSMKYDVAHQYSQRQYPVVVVMLFKIDKTDANHCYVTNCPLHYNANYLFPVGYINVCQTSHVNHVNNTTPLQKQQDMTTKATQQYLYSVLQQQQQLQHSKQQLEISNQYNHIDWQYQDDNKAWQSYSQQDQVAMQQHYQQYQQNPRAFPRFVLSSTNQSFQYDIDFVKMTQLNIQTQVFRCIQRVDHQNNNNNNNTKNNHKNNTPQIIPLTTPTIPTPVAGTGGASWEYEDNNNWYSYSQQDTTILNQQYQQYQQQPNTSYKFLYQSTNQNARYMINFKKMTQRNVQTRYKRNIRIINTNNPNNSNNHTNNANNNPQPQPQHTHLWEYEDNNKWHSYSQQDEQSLSQQYQLFKQHPAMTQYQKYTMTSTNGNTQYAIDFVNMTQTNIKTQYSRKIRTNNNNTPQITQQHQQQQPHVWEFEDNNKWYAYSTQDAQHLETQFLCYQQQQQQHIITFTSTHQQTKYSVDFRVMQQTNIKTSYTRQIRRV